MRKREYQAPHDLSKDFFSIGFNQSVGDQLKFIQQYIDSVQCTSNVQKESTHTTDDKQSSVAIQEKLMCELLDLDHVGDFTNKKYSSIKDIIHLKPMSKEGDNSRTLFPVDSGDENAYDNEVRDGGIYSEIIETQKEQIHDTDQIEKTLFAYIKSHALNPLGETSGAIDELKQSQKRDMVRSMRPVDIHQFVLLDTNRDYDTSLEYSNHILSSPSAMSRADVHQLTGITSLSTISKINPIQWNILVNCFVGNPYFLWQCISVCPIISTIAVCTMENQKAIEYIFKKLLKDMTIVGCNEKKGDSSAYISNIENLFFMSCLIHKLETMFDDADNHNITSSYATFKKILRGYYGEYIMDHLIMNRELRSQLYNWFQECSHGTKELWNCSKLDYEVLFSIGKYAEDNRLAYSRICCLSDILYAPNSLNIVIHCLKKNDALHKTTRFLLSNPLVSLQMMLIHMNRNEISKVYQHYNEDALQKEGASRNTRTLYSAITTHSHTLDFMDDGKSDVLQTLINQFHNRKKMMFVLCNNVIILAKSTFDKDKMDDNILFTSNIRDVIVNDKKRMQLLNHDDNSKTYTDAGREFFKNKMVPTLIVVDKSALSVLLEQLSSHFQ